MGVVEVGGDPLVAGGRQVPVAVLDDLALAFEGVIGVVSNLAGGALALVVGGEALEVTLFRQRARVIVLLLLGVPKLVGLGNHPAELVPVEGRDVLVGVGKKRTPLVISRNAIRDVPFSCVAGDGHHCDVSFCIILSANNSMECAPWPRSYMISSTITGVRDGAANSECRPLRTNIFL